MVEYIKPSNCSETEITAIDQMHIERGDLYVEILDAALLGLIPAHTKVYKRLQCL
jgi:hypothetical protein